MASVVLGKGGDGEGPHGEKEWSLFQEAPKGRKGAPGGDGMGLISAQWVEEELTPPSRLKRELAVSPSGEFAVLVAPSLSWGGWLSTDRSSPSPIGWLCELGHFLALSFICSMTEMIE